MTLAWLAGNQITGLSSDTKPTTNLPAGYTFFETDTRKTYYWDTSTWVEQTVTGAGGTGAPDISRVIYVAQDGTGDYTTLAAAVTAQGTLKEYKLNPGVHSITTQFAPTISNVLVRGSGLDVTKISYENGMGTSGAGINWTGSLSSANNLTSNTLRGSPTIVIANTASPTAYAAGDWVYIRRNVQQDDGTSSTWDAEYHRIKSVDSGTNMTLDFGLYNDFTTATSSSIAKVTFASGITFKDLTIYDNRTTVSAVGEQGDFVFKYCKDLTLQNVKIENAAFSSFTPNSCFNVGLYNVIFETPRGITGDVHNYGMHAIGANTNIRIIGGAGNRCRHTIDTDVSSGTPGRTRNIYIDGFMSYNANSAHFNTHQSTVGITFVGCGALGGNLIPASDSEMQGFGMRSPATLIGCFTEGTFSLCADAYIDSNAAESVQYPGGDRTSFIGCRFQNPIRDSNPLGRGIRVGTNRGAVLIEGCNFHDIPDEAIMIFSGSHHVNINGNMFSSCAANVSSSFGLIRATGTVTDLNITNNIMNAGVIPTNARPLSVLTSVAGLEFSGNNVRGYTNKLPVIPAASTEVNIHDNPGLNPIGLLTTPINTSTNTIGLYGGTTSTITTATDFTIVGSDVMVTVSGGTVSAILVKDNLNNTVVTATTTLNGQYIPQGYKLRVTYSSNPTVTVYAV